MKKSILFSLICVLLMLAAFSGCNKNEVGQKPNTVRQSVEVVYNTFNDLESIAKNAGDDCAKFGKEASDSLNNNKESTMRAMTLINSIEEDTPEMIIVDEGWEPISQIADDENSALNKIFDKCVDDPALADFKNTFLAIFGDATK